MRRGLFGPVAIAFLGLFVVGLAPECHAQEVVWRVPTDFSTIQAAVYSSIVLPGHTILVEPGNHAGAFVTKAVEIRGEDNAVINSGPAHGSGLIMGFRLLAGSDGASINHLIFEVDLAIMNGAAVNEITVDHCTFKNAVQAVSNWRGSGWVISHNDILDLRCKNGGGIGILVADFAGGIVKDNLVSHNKISGTLYVDPLDQGGYSGTGIVLYADFRWGALGTAEIRDNRIVKNKVSLVSDTPTVVDVIAFELTDTRANPLIIPPVLFDNVIGFNDFRGTLLQIALSPEILDSYNYISRNLGENRGHGAHPKAFLHD